MINPKGENPKSERKNDPNLTSINSDDALEDATVPGSPALRSGTITLKLGRRLDSKPTLCDEDLQ